MNFFVPGTGIPATATGFGEVFSDVDRATSTTLEFFSANGASFGTFNAPFANNGLSFLGVLFNAGERVGRVRITSGNGALGPNESRALDLVAMDDFIYAEPAASDTVPEPATLFLLGAGLVGVARRRHKTA